MLYYTREITQNISNVYVQKQNIYFTYEAREITKYQISNITNVTELFPLDYDTECWHEYLWYLSLLDF